ncbi:unnamed protein product [Vicia faba]|uniref:Uncharacterized protein n=1 Tax=Vicia faba TaxID=3906 RepID=A0AAV0ZM63_VICFA|nr:unnamed protein product [Vicia faba]
MKNILYHPFFVLCVSSVFLWNLRRFHSSFSLISLTLKISAKDYDSDRFRSVFHQERFKSLKSRYINNERGWKLEPDQLLEVHEVLAKHKLNFLNDQLWPVAQDLVLEFYANAFRTLEEIAATSVEPNADLVSWVHGKTILFNWEKINRILK